MYNLNKPINKIIEEELKEKTQDEVILEMRRDFIKTAISFQKDFMPYIRQYNGLLFSLEPVNTDLWHKIELYHNGIWAMTGGRELKYDVTNQQFVYHIGMENLASHIQEIVESIHNKPEERVAILQRFVPLQFGKEYPEIDCELNHVLSFAEEIGKDNDIEKRDKVEDVRLAVKQLLDSISHQSIPVCEERKQQLTDYIDGCIMMMLDLYVHVLNLNSKDNWHVPQAEDFKDGRERTLGNIFDDYLSFRAAQKN